MLTFFAIIHILIGLGLILFVLLQDPKGGAMGVFGGGSSSNSFFGSSGASNFLSTTTKWLAVAFAASCLFLTWKTANRDGSVMDKLAQPLPVPSAPASNPAAPNAEGGAPGADSATPPNPAAPPPEAPHK